MGLAVRAACRQCVWLRAGVDGCEVSGEVAGGRQENVMHACPVEQVAWRRRLPPRPHTLSWSLALVLAIAAQGNGGRG